MKDADAIGQAEHDIHVVLDDDDGERRSSAAMSSVIRAVSALDMPAVGSSSSSTRGPLRERERELELAPLAVRQRACRRLGSPCEPNAVEQLVDRHAPGGMWAGETARYGPSLAAIASATLSRADSDRTARSVVHARRRRGGRAHAAGAR